MKCDNCYCIYQSKGKCTLKRIQIDVSGMCSEKIYVDLDNLTLTEVKTKLLKSFDEDF